MSKDWYARKLGGQTPAPAARPTYEPPEILNPQAPMRGVQPPQPPPASDGSISSALQIGDHLGGAKTKALMAKGNCPSCNSVNYLDDPNSNTSAHCFECNYSPRLGNALSAE